MQPIEKMSFKNEGFSPSNVYGAMYPGVPAVSKLVYFYIIPYIEV